MLKKGDFVRAVQRDRIVSERNELLWVEKGDLAVVTEVHWRHTENIGRWNCDLQLFRLGIIAKGMGKYEMHKLWEKVDVAITDR